MKKPREVYQDYLKGDVTVAQAEQSVKDWLESRRSAVSRPSEKDEVDDSTSRGRARRE